MFYKKVKTHFFNYHAFLNYNYFTYLWNSFLLKFTQKKVILKYRSFYFQLRNKDLFSIHDTLIDQEYSFLISHFPKEQNLKVLDLGANVGSFAIFFASHFSKALIHSVELCPETYQILKENSKNHSSFWSIRNQAIWGISGQKGNSTDRVYSTSHSFSLNKVGNIQTINLTQLLEDLAWDKVQIAKIDIEGAESNLLENDHKALDKIENLVIEIHPKSIAPTTAEDLINILKKYYSNVIIISDRLSSKPLIWAHN